MNKSIGHAASQTHGFLYSHRFLILRRLSQLSILALFLLGPLFGVWLIEGNLSSSLILDTVPLTDPYVFAQLLASGHVPEFNALLGSAIVLLFYLIVGGRAYCSWVCPVNLITDAAAWLRRKLKISSKTKLNKNLRYVLLASTLLAPLVVGYVAWELINPVSLFHRGLIFGMGYGYTLLLAIFLFDLLVVRNGWCGHLCPMGAFYSLLNRFSLLKVSAANRQACDDCGDCYVICPEPQLLAPALKPRDEQASPVINNLACTNCGRCIDVCAPQALYFGSRFNKD